MASHSTHSTHKARTGDLADAVQATPEAVSVLTELTRRWVSATVRVDDERRADIALATYEALSNCAEHAYRDHAQAGTVTLRVSHDPTEETVRTCVTDHGRWLDPITIATSRGRGLVLMRALTDDLTINGRDDGTTVCLHFHHCPAAQPVAPNQPSRLCVCGTRLLPAARCANCG